jgi:threonine aldolase
VSHAIDLRSDTVTRPSQGMRRAMAEADVGDDVLDGDPTTRRLEARVAQLLGYEDAMFFPSGVQANQTAIAMLTERGTELLLEANAHLIHFELAGLAANSGVQIRPITTSDGLLTAEAVRNALRPYSPFVPRITAVSIENTHNAAGGKVLSPQATRDIVAVATAASLPVHLDGARLWNAAAALSVPLAQLTGGAATVMVSFSKGLGCPVGSCLAFKRERRRAAWEIRKRLGGGMRQSGVLAAAGLYALDHNLSRIADDHVAARRLCERLGESRALRPWPPETNIVVIDLLRDGDTIDTVLPRLAQAGVLLTSLGTTRMRAVTHLDASLADVEVAASRILEVLA